MYQKTKYLAVGDQYILVEFGNVISLDIHKKVRGLFLVLQEQLGDELVEVIPTYRSLLVHYDSLRIDGDEMLEQIKALEDNLGEMALPAPRIYRIPVRYGGEYGPDLGYVAKYNGLSEEEVIEIHTERDYLIYMLGFTPGFCYLGGMSERIATPRLKEPRMRIPAGSVGIAGNQTGMYPIDSPGGWQLIGRTPIKLFDPDNEKQPVLMQVGDYIRYFSVSQDEYERISQEIEQGTYQIEIIDQ
ncbi:MAG: 5-oxoprolinase subunit PxpB [Clostridia bacterium]